jgi:protein-L-isoaspartate(D-aspartate) O-methyltransferase
VISPLSFTRDFRRKMAELPQGERQEWLAQLAAQLRERGHDELLEQELREVARACRLPLIASIERHLGPFDPIHLQAVLEVPRERFVRPEDVHRSAEDAPLPLDDEGLATVSAPHAYLLSYRLVALAPGDTLLELGSGSGYGAALGAFIVGDRGHVTTIEIDDTLARLTSINLADYRNVDALHGDAVKVARRSARKIVVTFAVRAIPPAWTDLIPEGGLLVAPVGGPHEQRLVRVRREDGILLSTDHGAVRYVANRSPSR